MPQRQHLRRLKSRVQQQTGGQRLHGPRRLLQVFSFGMESVEDGSSIAREPQPQVVRWCWFSCLQRQDEPAEFRHLGDLLWRLEGQVQHGHLLCRRDVIVHYLQ